MPFGAAPQTELSARPCDGSPLHKGCHGVGVIRGCPILPLDLFMEWKTRCMVQPIVIDPPPPKRSVAVIHRFRAALLQQQLTQD